LREIINNGATQYEIHQLYSTLFLGGAMFAQAVRFEYSRSTDFSAYKTYQWVDIGRVDAGEQLLDQDIKC
jgi:hypothetical protein